MRVAELRAVAGVPECDLDERVLDELPSDAPPGPWDDCGFDAVLWFGRGNRAAAAAAGSKVADGGRALAVIGGLVSYRRTPVGAYREVLATVGLRRGRSARGTVPFMAVDSRDSLVGGRQNWSLPKSLARFTGEPAAGRTMTAEGDGWTVRATTRAFGPSYPVPMTGRLAQAWPDGQVRESILNGRGRARSAVVTVEVESAGDLAAWLRPGRHLGVVLVDSTFSLSIAR
jgi:Acetoacetate decarboxylase (ADC)